VSARRVKLISEQAIRFNGRDEKLLVFYNGSPKENRFLQGIDDPCRNAH